MRYRYTPEFARHELPAALKREAAATAAGDSAMALAAATTVALMRRVLAGETVIDH